MADNLLGIVQEFCKRTSLPQPITVAGSTDNTITQIWGLLNEGIQDVADRYNHQQMKLRLVFQSIADPDYLALDFNSIDGFKHIYDKTLWDASNRRTVAGPKTEREWQYILTFGMSQAMYSYTIYNNSIYIYPNPTVPATQDFSLFYQSRFGVYSSTTGLTQESYLLDTDVPLLPAYLVLADIKWRYKKEKGLPYAEDQRVFEEMLVNSIGRVPQGDLHLDRPSWFEDDGLPTLYIAAGNTIPP